MLLDKLDFINRLCNLVYNYFLPTVRLSCSNITHAMTRVWSVTHHFWFKLPWFLQVFSNFPFRPNGMVYNSGLLPSSCLNDVYMGLAFCAHHSVACQWVPSHATISVYAESIQPVIIKHNCHYTHTHTHIYIYIWKWTVFLTQYIDVEWNQLRQLMTRLL